MKFFDLKKFSLLVLAPASSFVILLGLSMGCAHHQATSDSDQANTSTQHSLQNTEISEAPHNSVDHVVIRFTPGKFSLSRADRLRLGDLIETGNTSTQVDKVKVAAWSDRAFPENGKSLNQRDRSLAESRAKAVERFLRNEYQISDIESFNMAEKSNWLARAFNTKDAELKSMFSREASVPITNDDFEVIKENGEAGSVVILIKRK